MRAGTRRQKGRGLTSACKHTSDYHPPTPTCLPKIVVRHTSHTQLRLTKAYHELSRYLLYVLPLSPIAATFSSSPFDSMGAEGAAWGGKISLPHWEGTAMQQYGSAQHQH